MRQRSASRGLPIGLPALEVGAGAWVPAAFDHRQLVQRGVELAISVAVEAVALLLPGGGIEPRDAGETRELHVGAKAADPVGLADELSRDQRSATLQVEELGDALRCSSEPSFDAIKPDRAIQGARRNTVSGSMA
ncbi:MAG TPA: hypothetical protein VH231_14795 [Solirubrobacteraceae bacterium]|nr:hypothetical protein [Solirubrobacteraceae bacterium]